jgi:hypothetical protein
MGLEDLLAGSGTRVRPVSLQQGEAELCRVGLKRAGAPDAVAGLPGRLGELVQQQEPGGGSGLRGIASVTADGGGAG